MTRRQLVASVVIGAALIGLAGMATADEESPGFWVEESKLNLGDVTAGQEVEGTFIFHNDTDAEVKILRAKPS